jgi:hypothetical protein
LFWDHWERPNNINQEYIKQHSSLLEHFPLLTFGIIVPLGLIGIVISLKQWRKLFLLYVFLFIYMCSIILVHVVSRLRVPFVQILIPFAAFTIYQGYIKLRRKDFKYIGFIILLLGSSLILTHAYDIYKGVEKRLYIKSHPYGTYILSNNILTICDDSKRWQGGAYAVLDTYRERVKKNLIVNINRDLSEIKKAYLGLIFTCPQKEGEIILMANNYLVQKIECAQIYTGEKTNFIKIPFDPSLLIQGENSFIFSVAEGGKLVVPIDSHYNYQRSAVSSNLGFVWDYADLSPDIKGKNIGEYIISLHLEFFRR